MAVNILSLIILAVGLIAPKFIGLEMTLTLQFLFFSQFLVQDVDYWPIAFLYLSYMKYSSGYNTILDFTDYEQRNINSVKYAKLKMKKTIVENFNTSFVILIVATLLFSITALLNKYYE